MHVWIGACLGGMLQGKFRGVFRLSCVGTWILTIRDVVGVCFGVCNEVCIGVCMGVCIGVCMVRVKHAPQHGFRTRRFFGNPPHMCVGLAGFVVFGAM